MSFQIHSFGHFLLSRGFYKIETAAQDICLFDRNNQLRGSFLACGTTNYIRLTKDLDNGFISPSSDCSVSAVVKIQKISAFLFWLVSLKAAGRRHVMQRFGIYERLLVFTKDKETLARSAYRNAEFRSLRSYGLDDETVVLANWDWITNGWTLRPRQAVANETEPTLNLRVCIYVHMHYWETWPEIETVLLNDCQNFHLIVTSTTKREEDFIRIRSLFPDCDIIVTENRGRDVGPFMDMLNQGMFEKFDAVCKIHGKLSKKNGMETVSGERIRRYSLACLMADGAYREATMLFASRSGIGLAGPANLKLPPDKVPIYSYVRSELAWIQQIIRRSKKAAKWQDIEFFAGTMFWFCPAALTSLRDAHIKIDEFALENGAKRRTLQHALERVFGLFVKQEGYRLALLHPQSRPVKRQT